MEFVAACRQTSLPQASPPQTSSTGLDILRSRADHIAVIFGRYCMFMGATKLTLDRSILMLEGLWDQLQSTVILAHAMETQPYAGRVLHARIASYMERLDDLQRVCDAESHGKSGWDKSDVRIAALLRSTFNEVAELLSEIDRDMHDDRVRAECVDILHQAQDATLGSLHELRRAARLQGEQARAVSA